MTGRPFWAWFEYWMEDLRIPIMLSGSDNVNVTGRTPKRTIILVETHPYLLQRLVDGVTVV